MTVLHLIADGARNILALIGALVVAGVIYGFIRMGDE